jgi:hypothetical protein
MGVSFWRYVIFCITTIAPLAAAQTPKTAVSDVLRPAQAGSVQIKGWLPAPSGAPQAAVMRGPIVLALDNRLAPPQDQDVHLAADADGFVDLQPHTDKPNDVWMAFDVSFQTRPRQYVSKPLKLVMCDFASAGNGWSDANLFRVWLPQPLDLHQAYVADTWKLMYPSAPARPEMPKF